MIDSSNPRDEGPLSPERSGALPLSGVVRWCFASGTDAKAVMRQFFGGGGLYSYLGTRDLRVVMQRVDAGEAQAALLIQAMIYQIAKSIGEMATVLRGRVDAIVLTGGMAHEPRVVEGIAERVGWIAGITTYPGEDELPALVAGALRVLRGEEPARPYGVWPQVEGAAPITNRRVPPSTMSAWWNQATSRGAPFSSTDCTKSPSARSWASITRSPPGRRITTRAKDGVPTQ